MHREVLTKRASELFTSLSRFSGFYLAGGTALALQIGHRISVDFDLFTDSEIKRSLLPSLSDAFPGASIEPLVNNADELTALVDGVKVTFLRYPIPPLDQLVTQEGVSLLSVKEIAATKAYTIGRRGMFKDYADLYFVLLEQHGTIADGVLTDDYRFARIGLRCRGRLLYASLLL
jgi:hypothetical protein